MWWHLARAPVTWMPQHVMASRQSPSKGAHSTPHHLACCPSSDQAPLSRAAHARHTAGSSGSVPVSPSHLAACNSGHTHTPSAVHVAPPSGPSLPSLQMEVSFYYFPRSQQHSTQAAGHFPDFPPQLHNLKATPSNGPLQGTKKPVNRTGMFILAKGQQPQLK